MTTFKAEISRAERRKDGTWNVKIRIIHKRKVRRYSTQMYATDKDVTRGGKLKNQIIIDNTEATIREWRGRLNTLGSRADMMDVDDIIRYLTSPPEGEGIPMFPWMEKYAEKVQKKSTQGNYLWAIRSLRNYLGMDITFQQLKSRTLMNYIDTLGMEKVAVHLLYLRKMYREAMAHYNDDEVVRIPNDPFSRIKIVVPTTTSDRSTTVDTIRRIAAMPDDSNIASTQNLARDMFLLSFVLMGTNLADLYTAEAPTDGILVYERQKTRDQRPDRALININIHPLAQAIIDRNKGRNGKMLNLGERFASRKYCHASVNLGMKKIKAYLIDNYKKEHPTMSEAEIIKVMRLENFSFYSARHSWATIARNDLAIDKWTVHEGLNHVDNATKITDVYIKRDFTRINEANFKVIDHVFVGLAEFAITTPK